MCRIKINTKERALVDTKTAEVLRPNCFDTLAVYHSYLLSRGQTRDADDLLRRVFKGEKVISDMIEQAQLQGLV